MAESDPELYSLLGRGRSARCGRGDMRAGATCAGGATCGRGDVWAKATSTATKGLPMPTSIMLPDASVLFRLFTFLLDKNGQLNYNIDITEPKAWI